jgi:hypothetical protein
MSLSDFFRINLPYGLKRNTNGEWFAFNREYMPIGWNSTKDQKTIHADDVFSEIPVYTKYRNLTEKKLKKIAYDDGDSIRFDSKGNINIIFLYNDKSNPQSSPEYWPEYLNRIKLLSSFDVIP